ncbi:MAG: non-ribosomal peptide synthetase [Terriglobia bacterium]
MKGKDAMPSERENISRQGSAPLNGDLRARIESRGAARSIPRLTDRRSLPLSFAQERVWLLEQVEPGSPAYSRPLALRLRGMLDEAALQQALQTIVDRHEVLRAIYTTRSGQPVQVISACLPLNLHVIDLSNTALAERESRARALAMEEALRPFDLTTGPILRAALFRLGTQEHVLFLVFHHLVFDAWSAQVLTSEFAELYRALSTGTPASLPEIRIQYGDFAHWQRQHVSGELLDRQIRYWKQHLNGSIPLNLPTDRPRPGIQSNRGGRTEVVMPEMLAESLKALGRHENATLFMVLLTAFQALLGRYTGLEDIAVGTPTASRSRVETEKLIGIFINVLVLRTDLAGNPTFRELLARVRETCRVAYIHQDLPFAKLIEALRPKRDPSTTPLFQVMFNLENLPEHENQIPGLHVEEFEFEWPVADYELTLEIVPVDRKLKCSFTYNADLFDRSTMERMAGHYRTLLEGIVAEPNCRVASLPLLASAELYQILVEWNRTEADYPRDATIHELFEAQAARTPEATAFFSETGRVSYRDLNRRANQIARYLQSQGAGPETFVGVCLERSLEAVVGLLGALKTGAAFVPLDPAYPRDRLAFMIADAQIPLVVSRRKWLPVMRGKGIRVVCLDADNRLIEAQEVDNLPSAAGPASVAYVLYTSGSSGVPKGVLGPHRGAVNRFAWMWKNFPFQGGEVGCLATSLNFVDSIWEVFGPLLRGIPSVIISEQTVRDPAELLPALATHAVTRIVTVPSLLGVLLDSHPDLGNRLPSMKLWVSSGEALLPSLSTRFYEAMPNATLLNLYGSTEVAADVTAYVVRPMLDGHGPIPLGRPIDNTQCYVLDTQLQPVPIGVRGDLYVGGAGLARGYCHLPELTAKRFVADPFRAEPGARLYKTGDQVRYLPDGRLQYLGRNDQQVKIRGFRVELEEIESILVRHPALSAAAVMVREEKPDEKYLMAYVVPRQSAKPPTPKALRDFLKEKLPDYMVPTDFFLLETLPLTPSGKLDRRALPMARRPNRDEKGYIPPRNWQESYLVKIWEELLEVRPIGIDHDFFDLGGHSLLAVRMMDRIEDAYGKRLSLATLFAGATIKHLAECLDAEGLSDRDSAIVPVQPRGSRPPFFFLHGGGGLYCRKLARLLGQDQPFYGIMPNDVSDRPSSATVEAMAEENIRQLVALQPQGPYLLGGYCRGGLVAYEMARQMKQQGLEVGLVILLDAWVPRYCRWLKTLIRFGGRLTNLDFNVQNQIYAQIRSFLTRVPSAHRDGLREFLTLCLRTARMDLINLGDPLGALGVTGPAFDDPETLLADVRYRGILMNYRPKPYPGRVVLLRTRSVEINYPKDRTAGWGKLAGQIEVCDLPGDHGTCQTEYVGDVAEHIGRYLRAYQADSPKAVAQVRCT